MSAQNMMATVDPDGKWLYRAGGISAVAFGIAYIAIIALYAPIGAPPTGAEGWLMYMAGSITTWWAIVGLSVLTDFLLVPVALSLYIALKGVNKNMMLLAVACMGLFVFLDLALTQINYASLIAFSSNYTTITNESQRAALVTAAAYPASVVDSNLVFVYNSLTLTVGILLTGLVMLKGIFNKATAYLALATGIFGIVAVAGSFFTNALDTTIIFASLLTTIWALFAGFRLYRLGQP